ncbi:hypothetical protein BDP27DRAFT_1497764 [Rhodocollybia butyracea]|uniref:Uncharacterized protein n=1 Tax=Rhodocollybia butyracea TaxID=206335 RepID=A0A9P5UAB9_9AGAR|nr:hypothetical protein BDP27DRAFT_1497764 [Rhodocollybia butyracea]
MDYCIATCKPDTKPSSPYIHALIEVKAQSLPDSISPRVFTFVGPKPHNYPTVPPETQSPDPDSRALVLPHFDKPGWFVSSLPFLGFAPSSNPFKCQFLRCLDYNIDVLPIELDERSHLYVLNPSLRDDWESLEGNMRVSLGACRRVNPLGLTPGFRFWSYPRQYGYCLAWKTEKQARWAAWRSHQAFVPLIAAISFFLKMLYHMEKKWVALLQSDRTHLPDPNPFWSARQNEYAQLRRGPVASRFEWQDRLQKESSISSEWLSYFYQILEIPMAGVYMNVNDRSCIPLIPVFFDANMPLVLCWGTLDTWYKAQIPKALTLLISAPTRSNVESLKSEIAPYVFPSVVANETLVANPPLRIPHLMGRTQPLANETIHEFIKRRNDHRIKAIASETPVDRQSRLQREENVRLDRPPGRKEARVYYWDLVEGVRVRCAAGRGNYESIWERYGPNRRYYESVADEWEVCTDLDPNDTYEPGFDDEEDNIFYPVDDVLVPTAGSTSSQSYIARLHSRMQATPGNVVFEFQDAIDDVAFHRFGFIAQDTIPSDRPVVFSTKVWGQMLDMIGSGRPPKPPVRNQASEHQMCAFFFDLLQAKDLSGAPRCCDLANSQSRPGIPFEMDFICDYFLIKAQEASYDEPFALAIPNASTVLEIARRNWGPKTVDIMKCLLKEGVPFRTLKPYTRPQQYIAPPTRRVGALGIRPAGFSPRMEEYRAYEHRRNEFLRSARGRAALLSGGLVARLARDIVNENDVFDGPTVNALTSSEKAFCLWDQTQNHAFWDDKLTEEEVDLICGTYEVVTDGTMQTSFRSWWPRPAAWKVCG